MTDITGHWQAIYSTKNASEVSWFEDVPRTSLDVVERLTSSDSSVIDVGAGASHLVDHLIADGYADLTVLDVSEAALATTRLRLAASLVQPTFLVADITTWQPSRHYDLWHDRAVFHFMTDVRMQSGYVKAMSSAVKPGGHAVVSTFADDGPEQCSGLSVVRYDEASLAAQFASNFAAVESWRSTHVTPWRSEQRFIWVVLQRQP